MSLKLKEKSLILRYIFILFKDTAIIRIEQVAPFPHEHLKQAVAKYDSNVIIDWVQE